MLNDLQRFAAGVVLSNSPATWLLLRVLGTRWGAGRFFLVYAYFRWADDIVDAPGRDPERVQAFMQRQERLTEQLIAGVGEPVEPAERCLHQALASSSDPGLVSAVRQMTGALCFDAWRGPEPITAGQLQAQIQRVGDAYTQALLHAAEVSGPVPPAVFLLARAATGTHHLRDLLLDQELGYNNLPVDHARSVGVSAEGLAPRDLGAYVAWRAPGLRAWFDQGLAALPELPWRARLLLRAFAWRYRRKLDRMDPGSSRVTAPARTEALA
jgi:phytoene/squalene synthetase